MKKTGIYGAKYEFQKQNVKVEKPDGKTFYVPIADLVMLVAEMKRQRLSSEDDYAILGIAQ